LSATRSFWSISPSVFLPSNGTDLPDPPCPNCPQRASLPVSCYVIPSLFFHSRRWSSRSRRTPNEGFLSLPVVGFAITAMVSFFSPTHPLRTPRSFWLMPLGLRASAHFAATSPACKRTLFRELPPPLLQLRVFYTAAPLLLPPTWVETPPPGEPTATFIASVPVVRVFPFFFLISPRFFFFISPSSGSRAPLGLEARSFLRDLDGCVRLSSLVMLPDDDRRARPTRKKIPVLALR